LEKRFIGITHQYRIYLFIEPIDDVKEIMIIWKPVVTWTSKDGDKMKWNPFNGTIKCTPDDTRCSLIKLIPLVSIIQPTPLTRDVLAVRVEIPEWLVKY